MRTCLLLVLFFALVLPSQVGGDLSIGGGVGTHKGSLRIGDGMYVSSVVPAAGVTQEFAQGAWQDTLNQGAAQR